MNLLAFFANRLAACFTKRAAPARRSPQCAYQSVYDENGAGTLELVSGATAVIPWALMQRIAVSKAATSSQELIFDIMAEFHQDTLAFSRHEAADFMAAMQSYLDSFDIAAAASAIEELSVGGERVIYRSPHYDSETTA